MKKEQYEALLNEWKIRLGLHDWRISLVPQCKPEDMSIEEANGAVVWEESSKTARVEILDEKYYGSQLEPFDWEEILVHELLHLKLCLLSEEDNKLLERIIHILIDDLARAFVDAKRKGE